MIICRSIKKMHRKVISNEEIEIIRQLEELSLIQNTLIHSVEDNMLIEYEGVHVTRTEWQIGKIYNEAIKPFHSIRSNRFTPGIYSFMSSNTLCDEVDYRFYLLEELNKIIIPAAHNLESYILKRELYTVAKSGINRLIRDNIEINDFCLLHGDLHNGNILMHNSKYALTDFEYMRFGPQQIEWAFFLFWDAITELKMNVRRAYINSVAQNIIELKKSNILDEFNYSLIAHVFLPVLLCLVIQYCENGKYVNNAEIINGINIFWRSEYSLFKGDLKC